MLLPPLEKGAETNKDYMFGHVVGIIDIGKGYKCLWKVDFGVDIEVQIMKASDRFVLEEPNGLLNPMWDSPPFASVDEIFKLQTLDASEDDPSDKNWILGPSCISTLQSNGFFNGNLMQVKRWLISLENWATILFPNQSFGYNRPIFYKTHYFSYEVGMHDKALTTGNKVKKEKEDA